MPINYWIVALTLQAATATPDSPWMHPPETPSATGDFTQAEREIIARADPGVEGSDTAIGSAVTPFRARLAAHGNEDMNTKTLEPEEWSKEHNIKLLSKPYMFHGTSVVDTDHGIQPAEQVVYTAGYTLQERPRRIALLCMDMMIDYVPYVGYMIPEAQKVVAAFRDRGLPVFWSNYLRRSNDGLYSALDRFYGPTGVVSGLNPMYVYAENGGQTVPELAPTDEEVKLGRVLKSAHLNKFADVDENSNSIFAAKLQELGVDTLVIIGAWTEDCVFSTVTDAVDRYNLDIVLPKEAVGTATPDHFPGMELMSSGWAKLVSVQHMVDYLKSEAKDKLWQPGRKIADHLHGSAVGITRISRLFLQGASQTTREEATVGRPLMIALAAAVPLAAVVGFVAGSRFSASARQSSHAECILSQADE